MQRLTRIGGFNSEKCATLLTKFKRGTLESASRSKRNELLMLIKRISCLPIVPSKRAKQANIVTYTVFMYSSFFNEGETNELYC